jgi:hypothetical protein
MVAHGSCCRGALGTAPFPAGMCPFKHSTKTCNTSLIKCYPTLACTLPVCPSAPCALQAARRGLLLGLEDLCAPFRMFQAVEDALQQGLAAAGPCAAAAAAGDHAAVVGGPAPAPAAAAAPAATGSAVGGASGANNEGHQQQPAAAAVEPPSGLAGFALPSVPPSGSILVSSAAAAADAPMNLAAGAMAAPPLAAPAHPPAPVPQEPPSTPGAGPVGGTDTVMGTGGDSPQQPGPPTSFMLE